MDDAFIATTCRHSGLAPAQASAVALAMLRHLCASLPSALVGEMLTRLELTGAHRGGIALATSSSAPPQEAPSTVCPSAVPTDDELHLDCDPD